MDISCCYPPFLIYIVVRIGCSSSILYHRWKRENSIFYPLLYILSPDGACYGRAREVSIVQEKNQNKNPQGQNQSKNPQGQNKKTPGGENKNNQPQSQN